jgi:two-component system, chemotaxis family, chemotaxis protein CheY
LAFDRTRPVLVVDDNFAIIRIVKTLLDSQGVKEVDGAGSGPEAIRLLSKKPYGVIISDFFMMPMNGVDLKLVIDRNTAWSQIPFLLMTTREETYDKSKFEKAKIRNVLLKPFTAQSLMDEIDRVVG